MKKEKVMYIVLPKGAVCQKVEMTRRENLKVVLIRETSKPEPLIGANKVYKKSNGYWYCRIKRKRDEFMYVDFRDLSKDDLIFNVLGEFRKFDTESLQEFKENILEALRNKPEEGFRWIPVYEPSINQNRSLQFVKGKNVLTGKSIPKWEKEIEKYSPENSSQVLSKTTYFLLQLRWLKDGIATIEQLVLDSKKIGNYWDSPNAKHNLEKTGEREFGGLCGFVGNTFKIVRKPQSNSEFLLVGGDYYVSGSVSPISKVCCKASCFNNYSNAVVLMELV